MSLTIHCLQHGVRNTLTIKSMTPLSSYVYKFNSPKECATTDTLPSFASKYGFLAVNDAQRRFNSICKLEVIYSHIKYKWTLMACSHCTWQRDAMLSSAIRTQYAWHHCSVSKLTSTEMLYRVGPLTLRTQLN